MHQEKWGNLEHLVVVLVVMETMIRQIGEQEIRHQQPHHKEIMEELIQWVALAVAVLGPSEVVEHLLPMLLELLVVLVCQHSLVIQEFQHLMAHQDQQQVAGLQVEAEEELIQLHLQQDHQAELVVEELVVIKIPEMLEKELQEQLIRAAAAVDVEETSIQVLQIMDGEDLADLV
jgi:hypothetical protein